MIVYLNPFHVLTNFVSSSGSHVACTNLDPNPLNSQPTEHLTPLPIDDDIMGSLLGRGTP